MKRHGITIPWIDGPKHQRRYVPDFLVEYEDGRKAVIEVKDPSRSEVPTTCSAKRKAAEMWCKQRRMGTSLQPLDKQRVPGRKKIPLARR